MTVAFDVLYNPFHQKLTEGSVLSRAILKSFILNLLMNLKPRSYYEPLIAKQEIEPEMLHAYPNSRLLEVWSPYFTPHSLTQERSSLGPNE